MIEIGLQVIAIVSTILCVVFTGQQKVICWPMGIISVLSLIGIYLIEGLFAQIFLQSVFMIQCIIGWYNWDKKDNLKVSKLDRSTFFNNLVLMLLIAVLLGDYDVSLTKSSWTTTYFDYISATLALLGNWYLTKKIIQAWLLFMTYNVLLIVVLTIKGVYPIAIMNAVLFFISLNGYITWKKVLKTV